MRGLRLEELSAAASVSHSVPLAACSLLRGMRGDCTFAAWSLVRLHDARRTIAWCACAEPHMVRVRSAPVPPSRRGIGPDRSSCPTRLGLRVLAHASWPTRLAQMPWLPGGCICLVHLPWPPARSSLSGLPPPHISHRVHVLRHGAPPMVIPSRFRRPLPHAGAPDHALRRMWPRGPAPSGYLPHSPGTQRQLKEQS